MSLSMILLYGLLAILFNDLVTFATKHFYDLGEFKVVQCTFYLV